MIREVQTKGVEKYLDELAKMSGKSMREVVRVECAAVLAGCVKRTRMARKTAYPRAGKGGVGQTTAKLDIVTDADKVKTSGVGAVWLSMPPDSLGESVPGSASNGYVHYLIKGPGGTAPTGTQSLGGKNKSGAGGRPLKWSNRRWALAQSLLAEADRKQRFFISKKLKNSDGSKAAIRGRGLAKKSWTQCGMDIGISVSGVPADVQSATTQDGRNPKNGTGREAVEGGNFFIEITNRYPLLCGGAKGAKGLDGAGILRGSIAARVNNFNISVTKGFINDLKFRTSHFPGLFVQ